MVSALPGLRPGSSSVSRLRASATNTRTSGIRARARSLTDTLRKIFAPPARSARTRVAASRTTSIPLATAQELTVRTRRVPVTAVTTRRATVSRTAPIVCLGLVVFLSVTATLAKRSFLSVASSTLVQVSTPLVRAASSRRWRDGKRSAKRSSHVPSRGIPVSSRPAIRSAAPEASLPAQTQRSSPASRSVLSRTKKPAKLTT